MPHRHAEVDDTGRWADVNIQHCSIECAKRHQLQQQPKLGFLRFMRSSVSLLNEDKERIDTGPDLAGISCVATPHGQMCEPFMVHVTLPKPKPLDHVWASSESGIWYYYENMRNKGLLQRELPRGWDVRYRLPVLPAASF